MKQISIESCLEQVPNKFELAILTMNRAKEILYGSKSKIENTKFAKKSVNKTLKEIENNELNLDDLKIKIKKNLLINNLFLKDTKNIEDNDENLDEDLDFKIDDEESLDDEDDDDFDNIDINAADIDSNEDDINEDDVEI